MLPRALIVRVRPEVFHRAQRRTQTKPPHNDGEQLPAATSLHETHAIAPVPARARGDLRPGNASNAQVDAQDYQATSRSDLHVRLLSPRLLTVLPRGSRQQNRQ